jgi:hypothetical protein
MVAAHVREIAVNRVRRRIHRASAETTFLAMRACLSRQAIHSHAAPGMFAGVVTAGGGRSVWAPCTDHLRLAVAVHLGWFKGSSREHTESDVRCYLSWCAGHDLDPLAARRPHLELYIRWMQEIRHFKPSTVSRRFSVTARFYRTRVIDGLLDRSPAEHVRRPAVPPESPTPGFTTCSFEALLTAAR